MCQPPLDKIKDTHLCTCEDRFSSILIGQHLQNEQISSTVAFFHQMSADDLLVELKPDFPLIYSLLKIL